MSPSAVSNDKPNGVCNGTANGSLIDVEKLAITPNIPDQIPGLLEQIYSDGKAYQVNSQTRLQLLENARSLVYALETPRESLIRHCWSEVCLIPRSLGLMIYNMADE